MYRFAPMTEAEAHEIVAWRYEPPYDFYDVPYDVDQERELLDADYRAAHYYSVRDEQDELVGYFDFVPRGADLNIGLGLRPDLTGRGLGRAFVEEGLEFGMSLHFPTRFTLEVAKFNDRARKLYEKVGFIVDGESTHELSGQPWQFHTMSRPA
jgi:[ribosomal protein S18]-alanine N-acetyltransferase